MYPAPGDSSPGGQWPGRQPGHPGEFGGQPHQQVPSAGPGGYPPPGSGGGYPGQEQPGAYPPQPGLSGGYPPQEPGGYPQSPAGGYSQSPAGGFPPAPAGSGYPPPGTGGYPPGPGGYPPPTDGPYGPPPQQRRRSRLPLVLGLVAGAVLLICGLGVVLVMVSNDGSDDPPVALPSESTSASPAAQGKPPAKAKPSVEPSEEEIEGDLDGFQKGDCLTMTEDTNEVDDAKCSAPGAYKVLLRKNRTISSSACDGTDATDYLTQDAVGTSEDFVLCIARVG